MSVGANSLIPGCVGVVVEHRPLEMTCELVGTLSRQCRVILVRTWPYESPLNCEPWIVIDRRDNPGYAEALNEGLRIGMEEGFGYFVISNNDIVIAEGAVSKLVAVLETRREIAAVSPIITLWPRNDIVYFAGGTLWGDMLVPRMRGFGRQVKGAYPELMRTEWLSGAFMVIRREALETAGVMPEGYFMYMEDVEWSLRVRLAGWSLAVLGEPLVHHAESSSSGGARWRLPTELSARFSARNAWILRRRLGLGWPFYVGQFLVRLPFTLFVSAVAGKPHLFLAYLKGLWEGMRW